MNWLNSIFDNKCERVSKRLMKEHDKFSRRLLKIDLKNANGFYVQGVLHGILLARRIMAEEMNNE